MANQRVIYAVDKDSKAHRVIDLLDHMMPHERSVVGDAQGWVFNPPTGCPVPEDSEVEVLMMRGHVHKGPAHIFYWLDTGDGGTIEFYRPCDDERKAVKGMLPVIAEHHSGCCLEGEEIARALYRAGYRKQ